MEKPIIYQVFTRLFGANSTKCVPNGSKKENGCGHLSDFTGAALDAIKELGATHIWYTGLIEHATQSDYTEYGIRRDHPAIVKGRAGSPYAIKDYYDIDPDLATKVTDRFHEYENLVKRTHKAGLKMIIDFVPNHVARQYHSDSKPMSVPDFGENDEPSWAFSPQNNFYYLPGTKFSPDFDLNDPEQGPYEEYPCKATGNDCFSQWVSRNDWYETVKLNYGIDYQGDHQLVFSPATPDTWVKMRDILLFWASTGVDGFRCDMAEMVPVDFWGWCIPQIKKEYPEVIFIAEVYNPHEYRNYIHRGKFDYLYDKVGLYDTLRSVMSGQSASLITGQWQAVEDIQSHMLNFLENHDEQRIASRFFAGNAEKGKPALLVSALMQTNPMMIYFGQELGEPGMDAEGFSGEDGRTTIFDYWTVDKIRRWRNGGKFDGKQLTKEEKELRHYYDKVLRMCNKDKAIREGLFFDIMYANYDNELMDTNKLYAFLRKSGKELILVVANFSDEMQRTWVKIPAHAFEVLGIPTLTEKTECKELLTHTTEKHILVPDGTTYLEVPANGGKILKFTL